MMEQSSQLTNFVSASTFALNSAFMLAICSCRDLRCFMYSMAPAMTAALVVDRDDDDEGPPRSSISVLRHEAAGGMVERSVSICLLKFSRYRFSTTVCGSRRLGLAAVEVLLLESVGLLVCSPFASLMGVSRGDVAVEVGFEGRAAK